jgi:hypothetical protein
MIMKKLIAILTLAVIAASPARLLAQTNLENDPGYLAIDKAIDFTKVKPEVNINLPKFLLKDALSDLDGGKNDPLAGSGIIISELIQDIKLIRVIVIEGQKADSEDLVKGMAKLRSTLESKWTPIVSISEEGQKVGVYAISDSAGESTAGLAVLIHEKGDAVIANIVGRISLGKIVKAASRFDKIPKDLLKKLSASAPENAGAEKPKEGEKTKASEKSSN